MLLRSTALFLTLLLGPLLPQASAQTAQKFFHDPLLSLTYSYPGRFTSEPPPPAAKSTAASPQCVQSTFAASSTTPVGSTAFLLSTIDNTCPPILHAAQQLGRFTKEQVLRQLTRYGTPVLTDDPTSYTIAGHPAALSMAWAQAPDTPSGKPGVITYAAKACVLGNVPPKGNKKNLDSPVKHVICFDFTTPQKDLLTLLLGFTIQFDNDPPQALIPGSILR